MNWRNSNQGRYAHCGGRYHNALSDNTTTTEKDSVLTSNERKMSVTIHSC